MMVLGGHATVWIRYLAIFVATLAGGMDTFHLARCVQDELDAIGTLVIDTATANLLGEIVNHGPWHSRQIAEVAMLPFRLDTHFT